MKYTESPERSLLFDNDMDDSLRIASATIEPNIPRLVCNKQCQVLHYCLNCTVNKSYFFLLFIAFDVAMALY